MINKSLSNSPKLVKEHLPLLLIFLLSLFLRVYRLDKLTMFGIDQGVDFLTVREMIVDHKWTLIGIKTSIAPFFQGPMYLYILFPFFLIFRLDPVAGAYAAVFISAVTLILLYWTLKKYFSRDIAIWSGLLFAVSPELVSFGNSPLYQHFLPLFIIISVYYFLKQNKNAIDYIILGFSVGLGMELHFLNITLAVSFVLYFLVYEQQKIKKVWYYFAGLTGGLLPTILFEVRHQFLNTRLFYDFLGNRDQNEVYFEKYLQWFDGAARFLGANNQYIGSAVLIFVVFFSVKYFKKGEMRNLLRLSLILFIVTNIFILPLEEFFVQYALPLWMILIILIPVFVFKSTKKKYAHVILFALLAVNFYTCLSRLNYDHGYNMPDGLTLDKIKMIGKVISEDSADHPNFNIASLLDGGTRAYPFRYSVIYYGSHPASVTDYPNNNFLYLITRKDFDDKTWEVKSMQPFEIGDIWHFNEEIFLYRLDKKLKG